LEFRKKGPRGAAAGKPRGAPRKTAFGGASGTRSAQRS